MTHVTDRIANAREARANVRRRGPITADNMDDYADVML